MKVLGIIFSYREKGNCANCIDYCLKEFKENKHETEIISIFDFDINPCSDCDYVCFYNSECPKEDGIDKIISKCIEADVIIFALPTYRGHLPSTYFIFSERLQGFFKGEESYEKDFLEKVNMIIIGNLSSGGDMALHEGLYAFINKPFYPETILLSSRDFNRKSIYGDLIEDDLVKRRLNKFIENILKKTLQ